MAKKKEWKEGEIALAFGLEPLTKPTPLLQEWLNVEAPTLEGIDLGIFERLVVKATKIMFWSEENLKMKFISDVLELGGLMDEDSGFVSIFDKSLSATVKGYRLSVKADLVIGSGLMDYMKTPYFHFQEYKPQNNPTGDSKAQLLEAFLIAQEKNADGKPLYGCEVNGYSWIFVTMEGSQYCTSKTYNAQNREQLLQIIAILRKFRHILETVLLK